MFATLIGGEMVHVPFRGEGPALIELMAGRLDLFFGNTASVMKYHEARQLKVLGLSWPRRSPLMPDVPAAPEYGMPDFVASAWFAIAAPPGTPAALASRINTAIGDVVRMPEVRDRFLALGSEPIAGTPGEMASMLTAERARWKKVIDSAHVKLD
jgi:tripartite-type tricarboxylate transporter receptor subunit TctC